MKAYFSALMGLYVVFLVACSTAHDAEQVAGAYVPLVTDFYPTMTDDLTVNGVCSVREAFRAIYLHVAVDSCPAGRSNPDLNVIHLPAGTLDVAIAGQDNAALQGDFDLGSNTEVIGDSMSTTIIDMHGLDRAFHASGNIIFRLSNLTIRNGCANGGTCNMSAGSTIPAGGGFYHNSTAELTVDHVRIESSTAAQGGGFAICAPTSANVYTVENVEIVGNTAVGGTGGGGIDVHMFWTLRNSLIENNTTTHADSTGGGIRQWDRIGYLENVIIRNNTSSGAGGGSSAVGSGGGSTSGRIEMVDGELTNNHANGPGGNVFVNAAQGGTGLFSSGCRTASGCSIVLDDVAVTSGDADTTSSYPPGSGGNLMTNTTSVAPGLLELRGSTSVSGGSDLSSPVHVDCSGAVTLYDSSSIADTTGCTVTDMRPTGPVCGNLEVEDGEDCDDEDPCCVACTFSTGSCDDEDPCTVGDTCSMGSCIAGAGSACGDGTLQTACDEECDDHNTSSSDGCSSSCQTETCTAWTE